MRYSGMFWKFERTTLPLSHECFCVGETAGKDYFTDVKDGPRVKAHFLF